MAATGRPALTSFSTSRQARQIPSRSRSRLEIHQGHRRCRPLASRKSRLSPLRRSGHRSNPRRSDVKSHVDPLSHGCLGLPDSRSAPDAEPSRNARKSSTTIAEYLCTVASVAPPMCGNSSAFGASSSGSSGVSDAYRTRQRRLRPGVRPAAPRPRHPTAPRLRPSSRLGARLSASGVSAFASIIPLVDASDGQCTASIVDIASRSAQAAGS